MNINERVVAKLDDTQQEILILVLLMTKNMLQASKLMNARFGFERGEGWFSKEIKFLSNEKITPHILRYFYECSILILNKNRHKQIPVLSVPCVNFSRKMKNKIQKVLLNLEQEKKQGIQTKEICIFQKIQKIIICMCSDTFEEIDEIEKIMGEEAKNRIEKIFFGRVKALQQYLSHETPLSQIFIENPNSVFASVKYVKTRKCTVAESSDLNEQTVPSNDFKGNDLKSVCENEVMFVLLKTLCFAEARRLLLHYAQVKATDSSISKYIEGHSGQQLSYKMLRYWYNYVAFVAKQFHTKPARVVYYFQKNITNDFTAIKQQFESLLKLEQRSVEETKKLSFLQKISKIIVYMHCSNEEEIYSVQKTLDNLFHFHSHEIDANLFNEICSFKEKYEPYFLNQTDSDIGSAEKQGNKVFNRLNPELETSQSVNPSAPILPAPFWNNVERTREKRGFEMMGDAHSLGVASKHPRKKKDIKNDAQQALHSVAHVVSLTDLDEPLNFGFDFNEPFSHDTELTQPKLNLKLGSVQMPFFNAPAINLSNHTNSAIVPAHTFNWHNSCPLVNKPNDQTNLLVEQIIADKKDNDESVHDLNRVTPTSESVQSIAISSGLSRSFWKRCPPSSSNNFEREEGVFDEFETNEMTLIEEFFK